MGEANDHHPGSDQDGGGIAFTEKQKRLYGGPG